MSNDLSALFGALSDPVRRRFVLHLARQPATVSELAAPEAISLPAVSRHLRVLERAGVVRREKRGRVTWCSLVEQSLTPAATWLEHTEAAWEGRLDRLSELLSEGD